jgi:hypothetical protein
MANVFPKTERVGPLKREAIHCNDADARFIAVDHPWSIAQLMKS